MLSADIKFSGTRPITWKIRRTESNECSDIPYKGTGSKLPHGK
eukprot:gene10381-12138_t